jgi:hypothetical protein
MELETVQSPEHRKMKLTLISSILSLFLLSTTLGKVPELKSPLSSISKEITKMFPEGSELKVTDSTGFEIHHLTQEFMIHSINMVGEISERAHKAVGPSHKGIIFKMNILKQNAAIQAVTPQTLRKPYWSSYINHLNFEGYSLFYVMEYGSRSDRKLIHEITSHLNSLSGQIHHNR